MTANDIAKFGSARYEIITPSRIHADSHMSAPPGVSRLLSFGIGAWSFLFVGLTSWATLIPLSGSIMGAGVVKIIDTRQQVQHLEGGITSVIKVREGQKVNKGDVLAILDTTKLAAELGVVEARLVSSLAVLARLDAEATGAKTLSISPELAPLLGRPDVAMAIGNQLSELQARQSSISSAKAVIDEQIAQTRQAIDGTEESIKGLDQQIAFIAEQIEDTETLMVKGLARKPVLMQYKITDANLRSQVARSRFTIAEMKAKITELDQRRRQLEIDRQQQIAQQRNTTEADLGDLRHRRSAALDALQRAEIRAPVSGTVIGLNTREQISVLAPREPLLEIIPDNVPLLIEAQFRPLDIQHAYIGQTTRVRLIGYNSRRTPMLNGRVRMLSGDALYDDATKRPYYKVEIELIKDEMFDQIPSPLKPGMPVEIFAETEQRTFIQYLLEPFMLSVSRAFRES